MLAWISAKRAVSRSGLMNCATSVADTVRPAAPHPPSRTSWTRTHTRSVAGHQPLPLHGVYSATKAFDRFFGESLWAEMQATGVDVLVLEPGATATEFQAAAGEIVHELREHGVDERPERSHEVRLLRRDLPPPPERLQ